MLSARRAWLAAVAICALWAATAPAEAAPVGCPVPSAGTACETLPVPLDRSGAVPGTVNLFVERRATSPNPGAGALIVLAGGPGQAATPYIDSFTQALAPALGQRNLVVFDERGTGRSGRLSCPALAQATQGAQLDRATEACANSLGASRAFYTSRDSADDIEAIRQTLGVDKISLYGVSYGTYTAMTYARRYPQHVERLVFDSVASPDGRDPFDRSTFAAYPRVLRDICARDCRGITSNVVADFDRLVARLRKRPARATVYLAHHRHISGVVSYGDLIDLMQGGDLDPTARAAIPAALHAALAGDPAALARLLVREGSSTGSALVPAPANGGDSDAVFLATACEEEPLPWSRTAPLSSRAASLLAAIRSISAGAFAPFDRAAEIARGTSRPCRGWPDANPFSPAIGGPLPDVPALIMDGVDDTRTPLSDAAALAALLPHSRLVPVPDTGHSVLGTDLTSCSQQALTAFFADAAPVTCRAGTKAFSPTPVPPTSIRRLRAATGVGGLAGRTLSAVRATLSDTLQQSIGYLLLGSQVAAGGLRGGEFSGGLNQATLQVKLVGVVYVPQVTVSGTIRIDLSGRRPALASVTVAGRAAAAGALTFSGRSAHGRLGGRSVRSVSAAGLAPAPDVAALAGARHPRFR